MGKSQQRLLYEAHRRFMRENKRVFSVCYSTTAEAQVINKKAKKEDKGLLSI